MEEIKKRFWLEKFDCFSISGKDAKKFLHGITTGNIINSNNKVTKTCLLSPNGTLRSLLEINCLEDKLELIILEGNINEIINYFNKVIFPADDVSLSVPFSKYRFQEVDEINSWKMYNPIFFNKEDKEYEEFKDNPNLVNFNELKFWKIYQAIPSWKNEIDGKNNPLELGLVDLIDFNKGCYLGQETISKIRNISSLKKEIRAWTALDNASNLESKNKNLYLNSVTENSVGKITSFHQLDNQIKGLALIKKKYLDLECFFYSEIFGKIRIDKSVGSVFL